MTGKSSKGFPSDLFIIKHYQLSSSVSVDGSAIKAIKPTEMKLSNPTGYIPVGVTKITTYSASVSLCYFNTDPSEEYCIGTRNGTSSSSTTQPILDIVYAPSDLVEVGTDLTGKPFKKLLFSATSSSLSNATNKKVNATDLGYYVPDGYQVFSITMATASTSNVYVFSFDPFEPDCMLQIRNASGSARTITPQIEVVFIRKDYAEKIIS